MLTPNTMVYGFAGAAHANVDWSFSADTTFSDNALIYQINQTQTKPTFGFGVESSVTDNFKVRAQLQGYNWGDINFYRQVNDGGAPVSITTTNQVRTTLRSEELSLGATYYLDGHHYHYTSWPATGVMNLSLIHI